MKKYIKPIANVVNLENECLLTNSDLNFLSDGDGGDALSRGFRRGHRAPLTDWDDEDED